MIPEQWQSFVFPPYEYAGIAVLRLPAQATSKDTHRFAEILAAAMNRRDITGKLGMPLSIHGANTVPIPGI